MHIWTADIVEREQGYDLMKIMHLQELIYKIERNIPVALWLGIGVKYCKRPVPGCR
jgi:hypothetical protein